MHKPVLLEEATALLLGSGGQVFVDCTLGLGGHAKRILEENPTAFIVGIDRDPLALDMAKENLKEFEGRFSLYKANYSDFDLVLKEEGISLVDGFLFDLGISMYQLKSARGFSFQRDEPLDMRMDPEEKLTAYDVVNKYSEKDLERIFKEYGEERKARAIAKAIVLQRSKNPIQTTKELVDVVLSILKKRGKIHPATKVFQAIRIEVNKELEHLKKALEKVPAYLEKGGRLVVISFHSLEDRIVKNFFKDHAYEFKILTKKPIVPKREEVMQNPASRSAKLRAGEKT